MNRNQIYHDLGFSIRKVNEDEIEIKNSAFDGYLRGFFRMLIIGIFAVIAFLDYQHNEFPLSGIYSAIKNELSFGFYSDEVIKPMHDRHIITRKDSEFIKMFPDEKILSYEEYKSEYSTDILKSKIWFILHSILFLFIFLLFFYPRHRSIRLNRKERVIYMQAFHKIFVMPVPDKDDPLMGMKYNRFSFYMFGSRKHFSLLMTGLVVEGKYTEAELLGCYPLPNPLHNMHLIKAMREFFTQENPEFLKHIGRFYRTPWLRPAIAFCNSFSFIRFPISSRKKIDRAIAEHKAFWNSLSYKQQMQRYDKAVKEQQELNEQLTSEGLINEVNNDWEETEKSPALQD